MYCFLDFDFQKVLILFSRFSLQVWNRANVLVDKFSISQQSAFAAKVNSILGCIGKNITSRLRKTILPLCSILETHIWSPLSSSGLPSIRETLKWVQERTTKIIKGLEHLTYEEGWESWYYLASRRLTRVFTYVYKYLVGENEEQGGRPLLVTHSNRTRCNGHKL